MSRQKQMRAQQACQAPSKGGESQILWSVSLLLVCCLAVETPTTQKCNHCTLLHITQRYMTLPASFGGDIITLALLHGDTLVCEQNSMVNWTTKP